MKSTQPNRRKFVLMNNSSLSVSIGAKCGSRFCVMFFVLILIPFFADKASSTTSSNTLTCHDTVVIDLGDVLVGDSVTFPTDIFNGLGSGDSVTISQNGTPQLNLTGLTGYIDSGLAWKISVTCKLQDQDTGKLTVPISVKVTGSGGCAPVILLIARGINPTKDQSTFSLQNSVDPVIAIETNDSTSRLFYFRNDSTSAITFDSLFVTQTNAFLITSHTPFHSSIQPHDSFSIGVFYQPSSTGIDALRFA